jgi:hypothetical protein
MFSTPQRPDRLWDPPNLLFNGYRGREDEHSPASSAEVKNGEAIPPLPHTSSCLVN